MFQFSNIQQIWNQETAPWWSLCSQFVFSWIYAYIAATWWREKKIRHSHRPVTQRHRNCSVHKFRIGSVSWWSNNKYSTLSFQQIVEQGWLPCSLLDGIMKQAMTDEIGLETGQSILFVLHAPEASSCDKTLQHDVVCTLDCNNLLSSSTPIVTVT